MSARWRWRAFCVVFVIVEGIVIGVAVRRPVVPVIGFCFVLTAIRLRLETLLP